MLKISLEQIGALTKSRILLIDGRDEKTRFDAKRVVNPGEGE